MTMVKFSTPGIAAPKCARVTGEAGRKDLETGGGTRLNNSSQSKSNFISFLLLLYPPPLYITLLKYHIFPIIISAFKKHTLKLVLQFCKRRFKKNCVFL